MTVASFYLELIETMVLGSWNAKIKLQKKNESCLWICLTVSNLLPIVKTHSNIKKLSGRW